MKKFTSEIWILNFFIKKYLLRIFSKKFEVNKDNKRKMKNKQKENRKNKSKNIEKRSINNCYFNYIKIKTFIKTIIYIIKFYTIIVYLFSTRGKGCSSLVLLFCIIFNRLYSFLFCKHFL